MSADSDSADGPVVMLVDNGSRRAAATLGLRRLATALTAASGRIVHAVSLQHADRIPADRLDGQPASLFTGFVDAALRRGDRDFVVVPLFFGASRALTAFIPEQVAALTAAHGPFRLDVAPPLIPLPDGEPRIGDILADHVRAAAAPLKSNAVRVVVVDHGSPLPEVTAVRRYASAALRQRLAAGTPVDEAVMERREGPEYDFNGDLLGDVLECIAADGPLTVVLAMLFLQPGRHAGPGGDISEICERAMAAHPGLRVAISPLAAEHPLLVEILRDRLGQVLASR